MADRHSLIPSIGLIIAGVWGITALVQRRRFLISWLGILAGASLVFLWIASWIQVGYWRDTETLFTRANAITSENYLARAILAAEYLKSTGDHARSLALARSACDICPLVPGTHYVLATVLQAQGKYHDAFVEYESALRLDRYSSGIRADFGGLLVKMNRDQEAIVQLRLAIELNPDNADAQHNLAICLANHNQLGEAIDHWRKAVELNPQNGIIQGWLAEALRMRGDRAGAIEHYRAAFAAGEHNPTWESNFAWFVATDPSSSDDEVDQAIAQSKDAVGQTGEPMALDAMAAALARAGRFDDAADAAQRAVSIAKSKGKLSLANEIQQRLNAYRAGRAYLVRAATTRAAG